MLNKKLSNNSLKFSEVDSDFIPYAAHFAEDCLITKSGSLIQVIKITGFAYEIFDKKHASIRESIRAAIKNHLKSDSFALWTHTIRRKKDLSLNGEYSSNFCSDLDKGWNGLHDWSDKYVNELFVTIITEPKYYKSTNFNDILKTLNFSVLKISENKFLNKQYEELNQVTDNFISELSDFGPKKLTIFKNDGKYYSEILRFIGKIINLEEREIPLKKADISAYLPYCQIVFANNSLEVLDEDRKHFAAILSVKEYSELSLNSIDKFLFLPMEFIVTQTIDFLNSNETLEHYKYQHEIAEIGDDKEFMKNLELSKMFSDDNDNITAFGEQQTTIMFIADSSDVLEKNIKKACDVLLSYGLVIYREDIAMENCFWSQLPGNFYYICRRKPINSSSYAGLASLSNFPTGKAYNNKWGDAVTCFNTHNKTPYFFNFHLEDNGHTMIIGPYGHGKTVLLNFLIAQSQKFNPRIIYLDFSNSSEIFINALGGKYYRIEKYSDNRLFAPLKTLRGNPNILARFLSYILIQKSELSSSKFKQNPEKAPIITNIVNEIESGKFNKLSELSNFFTNKEFKKIFDIWLGDNVFGNVFDNENDILEGSRITGIDFSKIASYKNIQVPITYYIMSYLENTLDGSPTILVIDEAFKLIDNPFLANDLHEFFISLKQKNALAILASESVKDATKSSITKILIDEIHTQIFLPQDKIGLEFQNIFKLNKNEVNLLDGISKDERHVLIKHGDAAIVAETDMSLLEDLMMVLSTTEIGLKIMKKIKLRAGEDPAAWLPVFREVIEEIINDNDELIHEVEEEEEEFNYENAARKEEQRRISDKISGLRQERLKPKKQ